MTCGQRGQFSLLFGELSELSVSHNLFTFTQSQSAGLLLFLMSSNVCIYLKDLVVIMYFTFPTWEIVSLSVWLSGWLTDWTHSQCCNQWFSLIGNVLI